MSDSNPEPEAATARLLVSVAGIHFWRDLPPADHAADVLGLWRIPWQDYQELQDDSSHVPALEEILPCPEFPTRQAGQIPRGISPGQSTAAIATPPERSAATGG